MLNPSTNYASYGKQYGKQREGLQEVPQDSKVATLNPQLEQRPRNNDRWLNQLSVYATTHQSWLSWKNKSIADPQRETFDL